MLLRQLQAWGKLASTLLQSTPTQVFHPRREGDPVVLLHKLQVCHAKADWKTTTKDIRITMRGPTLPSSGGRQHPPGPRKGPPPSQSACST